MMRTWAAAAAIAVVVAGCSNIKGSDAPVAVVPDTPATTKPSPADGGRGLVAKPASTAGSATTSTTR
jgi:PBP1b-binding outer membrane lipoprotein LpoB